jgi:hypothetical protein
MNETVADGSAAPVHGVFRFAVASRAPSAGATILRGDSAMRMFLIAAGLAAALIPVTGASAQYRGHGYGHYDRDVAREIRECRRELRRADSRREYRRERRECQREIRREIREDRWDRRHDRRWNDRRRYWDGYRWRDRRGW